MEEGHMNVNEFAAQSRARTAQLIRESRTLREAAEVRIEAPFSDMGQLLRAGLL
jgi:hypothetical protein